MFALVDTWSRQRLLFASLASSAFLVYLDPDHEVNSVRTLVLAQGLAALVGFAAHAGLGGSAWGAGAAMVVVIFGMILLRRHAPAGRLDGPVIRLRRGERARPAAVRGLRRRLSRAGLPPASRRAPHRAGGHAAMMHAHAEDWVREFRQLAPAGRRDPRRPCGRAGRPCWARSCLSGHW